MSVDDTQEIVLTMSMYFIFLFFLLTFLVGQFTNLCLREQWRVSTMLEFDSITKEITNARKTPEKDVGTEREAIKSLFSNLLEAEKCGEILAPTAGIDNNGGMTSYWLNSTSLLF